MRIEPEINGVSAVLLGDFNPAIFTPSWFALNGLLPERVAESAHLDIASREITSFSADWIRLMVAPDRFTTETLQAPHVRVRDLVVRVFKEYLPHTPLRAFGINHEVHFLLRNTAERDRIGRRLAPVEPWGALGHQLELGGEHGGMTSLTMSQLNPQGRPTGGQINITVEPSKRIGQGRFGLYARVNDHYAIEGADPETSESLITLFGDNFEASLERSETIMDHIMSLAEHSGG